MLMAVGYSKEELKIYRLVGSMSTRRKVSSLAGFIGPSTNTSRLKLWHGPLLTPRVTLASIISEFIGKAMVAC